MNNFTGQELFNFCDYFKTEEDCKKYLYDLKFRDGFSCTNKDCNSKEFWDGTKEYTKVCKNCRKIHSATSDTLFHKVKFGLRKAFFIIFDMTSSTKGLSANYAAQKYGVGYNTAAMFMKKVRKAMASSCDFKMVGNVAVDEFVIGGYKAGEQGRKTDTMTKIKVVNAVEMGEDNKVKRIYSIPVANYSSEELKKIFEKHISKDAKIITDGWTGYTKIGNSGWNIEQSTGLSRLYKHPINRMGQYIKTTIRGIYHYVSKYHVQGYLDELGFRINRSQMKDICFHNCVEKMIGHEKLNRLQICQRELMDRDRFIEYVKMYLTAGVDYEITSDGRITKKYCTLPAA